jgi:25S rRNA (uracil2634-N3)-methyltransferase
MILGFLRSVADFLIKGPVPSIHSAKRKQTSGDGDDEEDEEEAASASEVASSRGTVIITLRNVPPYTTWFEASHE